MNVPVEGGYTLKEMGESEEAKACFSEALSIRREAESKGLPISGDPSDLVAYARMLAESGCNQEDMQEAADRLELAVELEPDVPHGADCWIQFTWAVIHEKQGDVGRAIEILEELVELQPFAFYCNYRYFESELVRLHRLNGNLEAADRVLNAALEERRRYMGEEHSETQLTCVDLAELLIERGNHDEAETLLKSAEGTLLDNPAISSGQKCRLCEVRIELHEARGELEDSLRWKQRLAAIQ